MNRLWGEDMQSLHSGGHVSDAIGAVTEASKVDLGSKRGSGLL